MSWWLLAAWQGLGPWLLPAFLAAHVAGVLLALPAPPLALVGGVLFGPIGGAAANLAGVAAGAALSFALGRGAGRAAIARRLGGRVAELDAGLARHGLAVTLWWRLVPVAPDSVLNWGAGLTGVRFRDYMLGTILGAAPGAAVYAWLGSCVPRAFGG